jgi:hypothetical protein
MAPAEMKRQKTKPHPQGSDHIMLPQAAVRPWPTRHAVPIFSFRLQLALPRRGLWIVFGLPIVSRFAPFAGWTNNPNSCRAPSTCCAPRPAFVDRLGVWRTCGQSIGPKVCRWASIEKRFLTSQTPSEMRFQVSGFDYSSMRVPNTISNFANHAGCAGHAGAETKFPSTTASLMPTSANVPPDPVTSGETAG